MFLFSKMSCLTKTKEPNLPKYLLISKEKHAFPKQY